MDFEEVGSGTAKAILKNAKPLVWTLDLSTIESIGTSYLISESTCIIMGSGVTNVYHYPGNFGTAVSCHTWSSASGIHRMLEGIVCDASSWPSYWMMNAGVRRTGLRRDRGHFWNFVQTWFWRIIAMDLYDRIRISNSPSVGAKQGRLNKV